MHFNCRPQSSVMRAIATGIAMLAITWHAPTHGADIPDWIQAHVAAPVPPHDETDSAVILLDEKKLVVSENGKVHHTFRRVLRILRNDDSQWQRARVTFDHRSRVLNLRAWSIPAQGKPYFATNKQAVDIALPDVINSDEVNDIRTRQLIIPAAVPGSVVGYEWELEEDALIPMDVWDFQDIVPVQTTRYTIQLPPGWTLSANWLNHAPLAPANTMPTQWQWSLSDLPAIAIEPHMPPWNKVAGHMSVSWSSPAANKSTPLSWNDIGEWERNLAQDRRTVTPLIHQKVVALTAGKTSLADQVAALATFVQRNIRYVAIELGIGGYQPHHAHDVLSHGYGDCKDKVTLLSAMLSDIGIRSHYVLINTVRGTVDNTTSPNIAFNHMVMAIELPAGLATHAMLATEKHQVLGQLLYFDPTDDYTPLGKLTGSLQENYGLLITDSLSELRLLPTLPPELNGMDTRGKFELLSNGDLRGHITDIRRGDAASEVRATLDSATSTAEKMAPLEAFLSNSLAGFKLESVSSKHAEDLDQGFEWDYELFVRQYANITGELATLQPWVVGKLSQGFLETRKPRRNRIELGGRGISSHSFDITIPAGWQVDNMPEPITLNIGYAIYKSSMVQQGNTLHGTRSLEIKQPSIPLSDADTLKKFFRQIYQAERRLIVLGIKP